jgi:hypothetical protein
MDVVSSAGRAIRRLAQSLDGEGVVFTRKKSLFPYQLHQHPKASKLLSEDLMTLNSVLHQPPLRSAEQCELRPKAFRSLRILAPR